MRALHLTSRASVALVAAALTAPASAIAAFGELGSFHDKPGNPPNRLNTPMAIAADSQNGNVFVATVRSGAYGIDHLRADGTRVRTIPVAAATLFGQADSTGIPTGGLAVDGARRVLYVLLPEQCKVQQFNADTGADNGNFVLFGAPTSDGSCSQAIFEASGGSITVNPSDGWVYVSGLEHLPTGNANRPFSNRPVVQRYTRNAAGLGIAQNRFGQGNEDNPADAAAGKFRAGNAPHIEWDATSSRLVTFDLGPGVAGSGRFQRFTSNGTYVSGSAVAVPASIAPRLNRAGFAARGGVISVTLERELDGGSVVNEAAIRFLDGSLSRVRDFGGAGTAACRFPTLNPGFFYGPREHSFAANGDLWIALPETAIGNHYVKRFGDGGTGCNRAPLGSIAAPANADVLTSVTFDGSASTDPDTRVARYEWDLDGDGSYEVDGGASPTTTRQYTRAGTVIVGLRVSDDESTAGARVEHAIRIHGRPPVAAFSYAPAEPGIGTEVEFDGSASDRDGTIVRYEWDLDGNGSYEQTGAPASATHAFSSAGAHVVGLRVVDEENRTSTRTERTVTVTADPLVASFTATPNPAQVAQDVEFDGSGSSGGTVVRYEWDFDGNGSYEVDSGADATVTRAFATRGSKVVGLRVTDSGSRVSGRATRTVTVNPRAPIAAYTFSPASPQAEQQVTFDGSGSDRDASIVRYEWDLDGNGSYETDTGAAASATHTYPAAGTFRPGLRTTDDLGRTSPRFEQEVVVRPPPPALRASFTAAPDPAEVEQDVLFDGSGSSGGTVVRYEWDFDGNGSYEIDAGADATTVHAFGTRGSKLVGLRVTDSENRVSARAERTVTVNPRQPLAVFVFTPSSPQEGDEVAFDAAASDRDGSIVRYEWDLDGDGSYETDTGTTATVRRTYPSPGEFVVRVRVTDDVARTDTTTRTVAVGAILRASFSASPANPEVGQDVDFDAGGSTGGTVVRHEWDFDGNGSYEVDSGADATVTRSYSTRGDRTVGLRVSADDGRISNRFETVVAVRPRAPIAGYSFAPAAPQAGQQVTFDGATSDRDRSIVRYEWDLDGDGSFETDTGAVAIARRTYDSPGTVRPGLRVTDDLGRASARFETDVVVRRRNPAAAFTASPASPAVAESVTFDASTTSAPDGPIVRHEWDLDGNGSYETDTATAATTTRAYSLRGAVTVALRVTDDAGATSSATRSVTVVARPPLAVFAATPEQPVAQETVQFDASASDRDRSIVRYEWDLDGNGSYERDTGASPLTSAAFARGTATVRLQVTDDQGRRASAERTLSVAARPPEASFTWNPENPRANLANVKFDGSASNRDASIIRYEWDFDGDGTFEVDGGGSPTAHHQFTQEGPQPVSLRVTDENARTAITTRTVHVGKALLPIALPLPPLESPVLGSSSRSGGPVVRSASLAAKSTLVMRRGGLVAVPVQCPTAGACAGIVAIRSRGPLILPGTNAVLRSYTYTRKRFSLGPGARVVLVRITRAGARLVRAEGPTAVAVKLGVKGGGAQQHLVMLRAARR